VDAQMTRKIRSASVDDLAAIERIVHDAYVKYVERIGKAPGPMHDDYRKHIQGKEGWVICEKNDLLGLIVLLPKSDRLLLDNVAVDPKFQRKGIGRVLIKFAENEAKQGGYNEIRLYTHLEMRENISMYARLGYEQTGRGEQDGFQRIFFRKQISQSIPL
jgi:ribosomal protein S18 acetylase RimI-like enzyme